MKINEVEAIVGISKKNIRFYEEERLLSPKRNSDNGYRDYGENEISILKNIKFLRKLGIPIEEIRTMLSGASTVSDGMRRHLISLERDRRNINQRINLCSELQNNDILLSQLDTDTLLKKMEDMEKGGIIFTNSNKKDVKKSYTAPIVIASLAVLFMLGLMALLFWILIISPKEAPPIWFLIFTICLIAVAAVCIIVALIQRLKEIDKGELEDAKRY